MSELLSCPFCGGSPSHKAWSNPSGEYGPGCTECGVTADSCAVWNTRAQLPSQGGEAVSPTAYLTVNDSGQCQLSVGRIGKTSRPLYTHPPTTPSGSRVVPVELLEVCVKRWSILANEFITGSPSYEEEQLQIGKLRALLEVNP